MYKDGSSSDSGTAGSTASTVHSEERERGQQEGGGGHNNAQPANLRAMAVYWGPFLQRWSDRVSGLVTALCVLSMLIVLTDIMLRPSNDDRLICLSSPRQ